MSSAIRLTSAISTIVLSGFEGVSIMITETRPLAMAGFGGLAHDRLIDAIRKADRADAVSRHRARRSSVSVPP